MHYLLKLLTLTTCLQSLLGSHAAAQPITTQPAQRLYQGQDPQLADSPLKNYQAGYNTTQNHIYLNTQATDLSQGGNIMASLHHEAQRKEIHDNPCLRPLSEAQQTNLARLRGDRAQKVWNRLTDSHPNPTTTHAWNHQHQASLAPSNAHVAQARHQDVKPRVLEKLDPRYWQAKASGDEAKAQKIQAGWEKVEPWVPVLGSGVAAFEDFEKGQYVKATLQAGLTATEAIGLGVVKKLVTTGAQVGLKQGAKGFKNHSAEKAAKLSIKEQSIEIKSKLNKGKNSVTIETPNKKIRYDLDGRPHGTTETPHKQVYKKNRVDGKLKSITRENKQAQPMAQKDIRAVRKHLKKYRSMCKKK